MAGMASGDAETPDRDLTLHQHIDVTALLSSNAEQLNHFLNTNHGLAMEVSSKSLAYLSSLSALYQERME